MNKRVRQVLRRQGKAGRKRRQFLRAVHVAVAVVVWASLASVAVQLLYPWDRALPFAKIDTASVGWAKPDDIMKQLDEIAGRAEITVVTPKKEYTMPWASVGITIEREASAKAVIEYEWWERLVPFSSVVRAAKYQHTPLVIVDKERLSAFAVQLAKDDRRDPKEADVSVHGGKVVLEPAKDGYVFDKAAIEQQLQATPFASDAKVKLEPTGVPVARDPMAVAALVKKVEAVLARDLTIEFANKKFTFSREQVGSWVMTGENKATRQLEVRIDGKKVSAELNKINKAHASPPGVTQVTLLDGQEVARVNAAPGKAMNIGKAVKSIEAALLDEDKLATVAIPLEDIAPTVNYKKTYSQASSGLQAMLEEWERTTYGDFGVVIREVGGQNRYAQWQAHKPFVTSSTYKMFLAYTVLTEMEKGHIKGSQHTDMGWSVDDCITEMVVNSTNPCAISIQNLIGWQKSADMVHAAGFKDTHLNNYGGGQKYTTVNDEANFLLRLNSGTLMNKASTERLLGLMKRQIWRGGIPQGVPYGTVVANKVGFYNGWVHDVAIVYAPKRTYILAILSKGGSDPGFAKLSAQVYQFFNQ